VARGTFPLSVILFPLPFPLSHVPVSRRAMCDSLTMQACAPKHQLRTIIAWDTIMLLPVATKPVDMEQATTPRSTTVQSTTDGVACAVDGGVRSHMCCFTCDPAFTKSLAQATPRKSMCLQPTGR
jgi:hypothetical protein